MLQVRTETNKLWSTVCSDVLGYDAVSMGEFLILQRIMVPSLSWVR